MSEQLSVTELGTLVNQLRDTAARLKDGRARLEKEFAARKLALSRQGDTQ